MSTYAQDRLDHLTRVCESFTAGLAKTQADIVDALGKGHLLDSFAIDRLAGAQARADLAARVSRIIERSLETGDSPEAIFAAIQKQATRALVEATHNNSTSAAHNMLAEVQMRAWQAFASTYLNLGY